MIVKPPGGVSFAWSFTELSGGGGSSSETQPPSLTKYPGQKMTADAYSGMVLTLKLFLIILNMICESGFSGTGGNSMMMSLETNCLGLELGLANGRVT